MALTWSKNVYTSAHALVNVLFKKDIDTTAGQLY